jgi:hypothetical protein
MKENKELSNNKKLMADVVSSIVEKVLMNIGVTTHAKVNETLANHNLTFSDCYQNPDILNFALKELPSAIHLVVVEKIRTEFGKLEDDDHDLAMFLQKLGE